MNVNATSKFSQVPNVNKVRSKFDIPHSVKTSFNVGELIPFYYEEVLPGDTFSIETNLIARMQPLVCPIMDDIYLDTYYFYVPNRIVWRHWNEFMGENTQSDWYPTTEYNIPHVKFEQPCYSEPYTLADYFGMPVGDDATYSASQLPFRAYVKIWNEWFRDQNVQDPVLMDDGDSDVVYNTATTYGGDVLLANKYHDYFTSALPEPQKGPDVMLPLGDLVPVNSYYKEHDPGETALIFDGEQMGSSMKPMYIYPNSHELAYDSNGQGTGQGSYVKAVPLNLWADLNQASPSINAFRLALATQSFYEANARGGSRYRELIKSHFGVNSPDGRMQVPELLNYNRIDININQVVQQSQSTETSPLGSQAAYALSADSDNSFTKSFTEHGMVIGLCVARYKHSYQQGLDKRFSRRTMFDYYFPVFANLGEQPIYNREIFVGDDEVKNNEVFGYQEAYADYRYHPDIVTGEMRSNNPNSLDVWHLADNYKACPRLSPKWLSEDKSNVDRVLAVTSSVANQIWCDFYIKNTAVRVMPMYSIPGLPRTL